MINLRGNSIYLVPFEAQHLFDPCYFGWLRDREVMQYIGRDEYLDDIDFAEVEKYVAGLWANPQCRFLAIHVADSGAFIGTVKISFIDAAGQRRGVADIGIMIGNRGFWGRGLSTDVLRTACRYAFESLGARKLTAGAMASNVAVIKAFLRIGFCEEGRLRRQLLVVDRFEDHVLLGCFPSELNTHEHPATALKS